MNKFFLSFALTFLLSINSAVAIDFKGLTPGEILENQLVDQGIRFIPYGNSIKGTVESTPDGIVAQFHFCNGCEFFPSGAHAVFTNLQQSITIHLGLPAIQVPLQLQIKFSAFDGSGNLVASTLQNIIAGTGYMHEMTVSAASPVIASIIIETTNDFADNGIITLSDILFDPAVSTAPDFVLQGVPVIEIVAGGHQLNLPISILRLGSSAGDISFSASNLPAGVQLQFLPPPGISNTNAIGLELNVPGYVSSANQIITITGQPLVSSAGPSPRFYTPRIHITQAFTILSNADINISACKPGGPTGTVTLPVTVLRDGKVSGPATLSIEGLPSGVKAVFNPSVLTFPGNATGETSTLTITTPGGLDIGDVLVQIHATSTEFTSTFFADLHGQCPRENKDFTIKGFFYSNHKGLITPIEGALVEIYRDVPYWFDDQVGKTYTVADGSFELGLWANDEDTYYAKLQLNDEKGVYLHDGYNVGSWEANSVNRGSNKDPIIDLGNTVISKDDGASTPKASVWQGAHMAYQEYLKSTGSTPPGGDYEIRVWTGNVFVKIPKTSLTSTDWPESHQTNLFDNLLKGTDVFQDYDISFHEFGHTVRSSFDGDLNHFNKDRIDEKTAEIGDHHFCDKTNNGFAFSEGWAEFWSKEQSLFNFCPTANGVDFETEGNVANDLNHLMECFNKSRGDMVKVLGQRREFIHSDADFRQAFQSFFQVDLSACPPFGAPGTLRSGQIPANILSARPVPLSLMIERMQANIDQQAGVMQQLQKDFKTATEKAAATDVLNEKDTSQLAIILTAPIKIKGQLQLLQLLQTVFQQQLVALKQGNDSITRDNPAYNDSVAAAAAEFNDRAKAIAIQNLIDCKTTIIPYASSPAIKNIIAQLDRKIKLLQVKSTHPINVFDLLKVPRSYSDDKAVAQSTKGGRWWLWILIAAILIVIVAVWMYRRKS